MRARHLERCLPVALAALFALPAATAFGDARVRFLNADPESSRLALTVDGRAVGGGVGFGASTAYVRVAPGRARLVARRGERRVASARAGLADGTAYTVVAFSDVGPQRLRAFADPTGTPGRARVRVIQGAAELGEPDLRLDDLVLGQAVGFTEATPGRSLEPGSYSLTARDPAANDRSPIVERKGVSLSAGAGYTAVVAGSGGRPARFLVLANGSASPGTEAPKTGLRGPEQVPWLAAVLAALAAGLAGGMAHRSFARPR